MNKNELISKVQELSGLSKKDSTSATEAVFEAITGALKSGDSVKIQGFGNFEARERAARKGRNPQTGAEIDIEASTVPAFKPAKALKESVNK